ncbi:MAG TPA: class I SAM-dependent methyltransferase [Longilinea sp.]|nr:class I SAM-dependent methyltransferase [Longilinea sp.]
MMEPKQLLGEISGGQILDVATGGGGFIHFLTEGLKSYADITGIDITDRSAAAFSDAFKDNPAIHFQNMDAEKMTFSDASFDTVSIANSLHHFDDPKHILAEMYRVLKPGGHFIVFEMYCDNQTETQLTHVNLHHWWGAVDRLNGVAHNSTHTRQELVDMVKELGLRGVVWTDIVNLEDDPHDPAIIAELAPVFERYLQRAESRPDLVEEGKALQQRVKDIGFHSASALIAIGRK